MDARSALRELQEIVGPDHVVPPEGLLAVRTGGVAPALCAVVPGNVAEVQQVVRWSASKSLTVIPLGAQTMAFRCSTPQHFDIALLTTRLDCIEDYQRENLVLAVGPGATGAQVRELLSPEGQMLALDPPRCAEATLGGIVASRAAGPSRLGYGGPRDLVLGVKAVDAAGEIVSSGGRVMKNAAGYDLCKLYTGSLGTLGIIVEIAFRLHPLPECSQAFIGAFANWEHCDRAVARVSASQLLPRSLEVLNNSAARRVCPEGNAPEPIYLVAAFDGTGEQIARQRQVYFEIMDGCQALEQAEQPALWHSEFHRALCDLEDCNDGGSLFIARGLPSDVPVLARHFEEAFAPVGAEPRIAASAGNGIVRAVVDQLEMGKHDQVRRAFTSRVANIRGLSLAAFRHEGGTWQDVWPTPVAGVDVMRAIKRNLDPGGVFPPGRFVGGL